MSETPGEGHNSDGLLPGDRLRSFIERIERLQVEQKALGNDVKDLFAESKASGFDPGVMRKLIALRKKDPNDVKEEEDLLQIYRDAMGVE
jgi:uncharacterized protein (UPF0335 family)